MSNAKKSVMSLASKSQENSGVKVRNDSKEIKEEERGANREKPRRKLAIFHSLSLVALHALDSLLLIILLPFMIWQWVSASDRLKIILKAVVEVSLELIIWIIFAGVSIFMTTIFVLEDMYIEKKELENLKEMKGGQRELPSSTGETQNVSKQ